MYYWSGNKLLNLSRILYRSIFKQAFGNKSNENIASFVSNKQVIIEYSKKYKYGRTLGKNLVDGTDANLQHVKAGLAWHYKKYQKEQSIEDRRTYAYAEEYAPTEKQRLWIDPDPNPPWDWRH